MKKAPFVPGRAAQPELELVLLCGRRRLSPEERADARRLASGRLDWERIFRFAVRHGLGGFIVGNLEDALGDRLPPDWQHQFRDRARRLAIQNLLTVRELIGILDDLGHRGIVAVPYKGPALSAQLYGSLALRESCDLDVLVHPWDADAARDVLVARGYREGEGLVGPRRDFMLESRYGQRFERPGGRVVELHWAFTNRDVAFPLNLEAVTPRLVQVSLGGRTVPAFGYEDLILILCVHGAKHRWDRLEWILGVGEVTERVAADRWNEVMSRAEALRCRRAFLLGLLLAHRYARVELPAQLKRAVHSDSKVLDLAAEVDVLLREESPLPESRHQSLSLKHDLFHIGLREGFADRTRYLRYRFTTPSRPADWRAIELGGRAIRLHALLRPLRATARLIPALWRYLRRERHGLRSNGVLSGAGAHASTNGATGPNRSTVKSSGEPSLVSDIHRRLG